MKYFVYRLVSRFHGVFKKEGIEKDARKIITAESEFWEKIEQPGEGGNRLAFLVAFFTRVIRITHFQTSLDFRVFTDIRPDDLKTREVFNTRTRIIMEKINRII